MNVLGIIRTAETCVEKPRSLPVASQALLWWETPRQRERLRDDGPDTKFG